MTPLRQRMIDAMVLRGVAARSQETYLPAVGQIAGHHRCSPVLLTDEQVQAYLLYLLQERQRLRSTVNIASCALRFLVCDVLGQDQLRAQVPVGRNPQPQPAVLSRADMTALLSPKARMFLTLAYASGLRLSELDIDARHRQHAGSGLSLQQSNKGARCIRNAKVGLANLGMPQAVPMPHVARRTSKTSLKRTIECGCVVHPAVLGDPAD
jgi:hypothetical protein